jgi:hypothetical protein
MHAGRQAGRQTDRQTDRHTGTQTAFQKPLFRTEEDSKRVNPSKY